MNYEEKYTNALRRAKKLYGQGTITECLGWVFPEIKESADEKIRKAIMACCSDHGHKYQYTGITTQDMMYWLEKQGEQSNTELRQSEVTTTSDPIKSLIKGCIYASDITPEDRELTIAWLEKQGN